MPRLTDGDYIDAQAFTKLFRHRRKNFAQICVGLRSIVCGVGRRVLFMCTGDAEEMEAEVLAFCIERVGKFDRSKGATAFAYYTAMAFNAFRHELRDGQVDRRRASTFSQLSHDHQTVTRWARDCHSYFDRDADYLLHGARSYVRAAS